MSLFAAALKAIDDAGCDTVTKRRVREVHEIPGALWQIYDAHDADKIRDFLNKVGVGVCVGVVIPNIMQVRSGQSV